MNNRSYTDLARHYGTAVLPARPRRPRDKAKVEACVGIVERRVLGRLRNRIFYSLPELNSAIGECLCSATITESGRRQLRWPVGAAPFGECGDLYPCITGIAQGHGQSKSSVPTVRFRWRFSSSQARASARLSSHFELACLLLPDDVPADGSLYAGAVLPAAGDWVYPVCDPCRQRFTYPSLLAGHLFKST